MLMGRSTFKRLSALVSRSGLRRVTMVNVLLATAFLFCQCHRQSPAPTPTPEQTVAPTPIATATVTATVTPIPTVTPAATLSPLPTPLASPTPDAFQEGIIKLLQASRKGFLDLRGKFERTENGSGPDPLFRIRKIYQGTFLLADVTSAEVEEVYFNTGRQPAYNYHLNYQTASRRDSVEKYDSLRLNLDRVLKDFEHTFGGRYDSWAREDPLKTAVLLSSKDVPGAIEIQIHTAFSTPQW
jgi:hypothetical protein